MLALLLFRQNLNLKVSQKAKEFVDMRQQSCLRELLVSSPLLFSESRHSMRSWEREKWKHETENVSHPSSLAELGSRTPFSCFQDSLGLSFGRFC